MTNKPMLSVELRSGLERLLENGYAQYLTKIDAVELQALLDAPAAQHQGEPVAYWYVGDVDGYGCLYTAPDKDGIKIYAEHPAPVIRCSFCDVTDNAGNPWSGHHESVDGKLIYRVMGCKDHKHLVEALDGSKSTPVEDHTQCEECKGWGYHENHHDGGGTECGECGGSGKATVSVVMPEPYSLAMFQMISGFESVTPEQFDLVWSACREEVSRLNGIKL